MSSCSSAFYPLVLRSLGLGWAILIVIRFSMVETVMCGFGVDYYSRYQKQTARENVTVTTENKGSYPQIIVRQHKRILIKELGYRLAYRMFLAMCMCH